MPKYVVFKGLTPGIYDTWAECSAQVNGFPKALFKKYDSLKEAEEAVEYFKQTGRMLGANYGANGAKAKGTGSVSAGAKAKGAAYRSASTNAKGASVVTTDLHAELADFFVVHPNAYEVWTDGGSDRNGDTNSPSGFGYVVLSPDKRIYAEGYGSIARYGTNQNMELLGAIYGLNAVPKDAEILYLSDMKELYLGVTNNVKTKVPKYLTYKARGWQNASGNAPQNLELVSALAEIIEGRPVYGIPRPMKANGEFAAIAHADSKKDAFGRWPYPANRICDKLAEMGKRAVGNCEGAAISWKTTSTKGTVSLDGYLVELIAPGAEADARALYISGRDEAGYGIAVDAAGREIETI